ncbi:MAG: hypothetical protein JW985_01555 [Alphaproteobacteria bacterium]|nr:hypothetical protein [Alphaproteobacteria bacterium]
MKKIINHIFGIVAGLSTFILLTGIIVSWVSNIPFVENITKDFVIGQIFVEIIVLVVLILTNVNDIAEWLTNDK